MTALLQIPYIQDALKSPFGSFGFISGILLTAFWAVHAITKHTTKWSLKLENVKKIENKVSNISTDMAIVKAFIVGYNEKNNPFAKAQSPMKLTSKGVEVHQALNIKTIIINHWDAIEKDLDSALNSDCNSYDIQQESIKIASVIQKYLTTEELNAIKLYAFNNGHNIADYDILIGIEIRDNYFTKIKQVVTHTHP